MMDLLNILDERIKYEIKNLILQYTNIFQKIISFRFIFTDNNMLDSCQILITNNVYNIEPKTQHTH